MYLMLQCHYRLSVKVKPYWKSRQKVKGQSWAAGWVGTRRRRVECCRCCVWLFRFSFVKLSLATSLTRWHSLETHITCCQTSWLYLSDLPPYEYDNWYSCSRTISSNCMSTSTTWATKNVSPTVCLLIKLITSINSFKCKLKTRINNLV